MVRLPDQVAPLLQLARFSEYSGDWAAAERYWRQVKQLHPECEDGVAGLVRVLRLTGQLAEAASVVEAAFERNFDGVELVEQAGLVYIAQERWPFALEFLKSRLTRYPSAVALRRRIHEVELRLIGDGTEAPAEAGEAGDRRLLMQFESLGGDQHGCEFGLFQRSLGAEPISLLRWTSLAHDTLATILETDFHGVGEAEFTRLETFGTPPVWKTNDTRFFMWMQTFVDVNEVPADKMLKQVVNRMRFLRRKVIADLSEGCKIFVFRNMARNLTDVELARLHAAIRRYGPSTLLYICYSSREKPAGLVETRAPGLLVGYLDYFLHTPRPGMIGPVDAHTELLALCRRAHALWDRE